MANRHVIPSYQPKGTVRTSGRIKQLNQNIQALITTGGEQSFGKNFRAKNKQRALPKKYYCV